MARQGRHSSQELWTEGEALERAGKLSEAVGLFAKAAVAEEEAGQPLRARILWERIAGKAGATGVVLERLAGASERAKLVDEAFDYWAAASARYAADGRTEDAKRTKERAQALKARVGPHERPKLAADVLSSPAASAVKDLL